MSDESFDAWVKECGDALAEKELKIIDQAKQIGGLNATIAALYAEIDRLKADISEVRKAIPETLRQLNHVTRERDSLQLAVEAQGAVLDKARECERPTLKGAASGFYKVERDGLSFVAVPDDRPAELAELYEVEVPNDDEAVSYAARPRRESLPRIDPDSVYPDGTSK